MNFPHMNIECFIIMKQATKLQLTIYYVLENFNSQMLVNLVAPKQKIKDQIFNVNQKHKLYVSECAHDKEGLTFHNKLDFYGQSSPCHILKAQKILPCK